MQKETFLSISDILAWYPEIVPLHGLDRQVLENQYRKGLLTGYDHPATGEIFLKTGSLMTYIENQIETKRELAA